MTNFEKMCAETVPLFLSYDQEEMIRRCALRADEDHLYPVYLGEELTLERRTGRLTHADGSEADPGLTLIVFDYLCHDTEPRPLSGRLCPASALPGLGVSRPKDGDFYGRYGEKFDSRTAQLAQTLSDMGGRPFPTGDAAAEFQLFPGFPLVFQFWEGDEEFPSSVRFLWDERTTDYLHFETLFYIMGAFLQKLSERLDKRKESPT